MKLHNHLVLDYADSIELNELKNKTTILMATSQVDIIILMWSVFSFFLRSNSFEHFTVCINGPNKNTGDTSPQDIKQRFFEKLINDYDLPISLMRILGRQGHAHSIDSCIPWVHTEYYTLVHDDVIILKDWQNNLESTGYLSDPNRSIILSPPTLVAPMQLSKYNDKHKLGIPHLSTFFTYVKKSFIEKHGLRWHGNHSEFEFVLEGDFSKDFLDFYKKVNISIEDGQKFYYHSTDVGSYIWYKVVSDNYKIYNFDKDICLHIEEASWSNSINLAVKIFNYKEHIKTLQDEILNSRFCDIYKEFCSYTNIDFH